MGDRTFVEIQIRKDDYHKLMKNNNFEIEDLHDAVGYDNLEDQGSIISFQMYECNYAEWASLENLLVDFELNKFWEDGGDYEGGEYYRRKIKGELNCFEITNSKSNSLNTLESLLETVKDLNDPDGIKKVILDRIKDIKPFELEPLDKPLSVKFIEE